MRLSAYSDYAFRVLMQAALRMPQRITVDQVAETFGISRHHLIKVAHDLGRSGYLQTQRGVGSGFTLGRAPDNIRVGDIVRLGEESETVIDCMERQGFACRVSHPANCGASWMRPRPPSPPCWIAIATLWRT